MTTVHFIYPHGPAIACPDAIGRNVGQRLRERYGVIQYDWDDTRAIAPGPDDVLLGHPHPNSWTIFRRSAKRPGWKRIISLSPYHHGDLVQVAFVDSILPRCDLYLAITGNYWFQSIGTSMFSQWLPKMVHVDLAVDRADFPVVKRGFNPPGRRKFLYVGHSGWPKNTEYLTRLAELMPESNVSWIGEGKRPIRGLHGLGRQDFRTETARQLIRDHDFLITVGRADAAPATVLEGMAWGLIPVCTPQSGYVGFRGIQNVPLDAPRAAVDILRRLQFAPNQFLERLQRANWEALDAHFNWERFTSQVVTAIESDASPPCEDEGLFRLLRLRWAALSSPYSTLRPSNWKLLWHTVGIPGSRDRRNRRVFEGYDTERKSD